MHNGVPINHVPYDKVKVGKRQHNDAQKGGHSAVEHGGKHVLQRHHNSSLLAADARDEALEFTKNNIR